MKITQLETIRLGEFPNIIWVRMHTDEGLVGLGETFMGAQAVEAYFHEWVAPKLLGKDPLAIEVRNKDMLGYRGWRGSGVETRGNSAVDIALWDIFGKAANMPVHTALGGQKPRCHPHLQHLCRLPVCAQHRQPEHGQPGARSACGPL
jgi:galactonate dehydratase